MEGRKCFMKEGRKEMCYEGRKEMFYLTTHSTKCFFLTTHSKHFSYGYMALNIMVKDHSDIEKRNPQTPYMGHCLRFAQQVRLHAPSHRQDSTYHGL